MTQSIRFGNHDLEICSDVSSFTVHIFFIIKYTIIIYYSTFHSGTSAFVKNLGSVQNFYINKNQGLFFQNASKRSTSRAPAHIAPWTVP